MSDRDIWYAANPRFRDGIINLDDLHVDPVYEIIEHRHILQFVGSSTSAMTYTCQNCDYQATYHRGAVYLMLMGGLTYDDDKMRVKDPEWR